MDEVEEAMREPGAARPRGRLPRGLMLSVLFPVGAWMVGAMLGLVAGLGLVVVWWTFAPRARWLWLAGIGLLALSPILLIGQGLPHAAVVGASFGTNHLLAHHSVIVALLCVAFAALVEVTGLDAWLRPGLFGRRRRDRLSPSPNRAPPN
jgi:hypothetical protein